MYYYYEKDKKIWAVSCNKENLVIELTLRFPELVEDPTLFPNVKLKEEVQIKETTQPIYNLNGELYFDTDENFESLVEEQLENMRKVLRLTPADLQRFIYADKKVTMDDIKKKAEAAGVDPTLLDIEMQASYFYRNHPFIVKFGEQLGYLPQELDYMFYHGKAVSEDPETAATFKLVVPYYEEDN